MAKEAILETITDFHAVATETESAFLFLWSADHVKATCKSCYGTVQIIRKLKNFAGYRLRKHLVESLVLSELDYCDTVYYPLPEFQLKRLQRVQLVAASLVVNRYLNDINDIVKIDRVVTSKTGKRFPRSQTRSQGLALPQLAVLCTTRYS